MQRSSHGISNNLWPSGSSRAIAVLSFEPEELARRYGLRFQEDVDDLDTLLFAVLRLDNGSNAMLYKHVGDPNPGTIVNVDAHADLAMERELLVSALHLQANDLLWIAPEARKRREMFA
ncbi:MAG: hypothetical protein ACR2M3_01655 [Thermomicrobiales bacterium]